MDQAASLFRVFDLAFFAPGGLILVAAWQGKLLPSITRDPTSHSTVVAVVAAILFAFVTGALCHAVCRFVLTIVGWRRGEWKAGATKWKSWYKEDYVDDSRFQIAQYFWYMRATFANLAVAFPIAWALWRRGVDELVLLPLAASVVFVLLSYDYGCSLNNVSK